MSTITKTFNRGKLRRLVEAGKVTLAGSYHFDDMYGESRDSGQGLPVAIVPEHEPGEWRWRKEGICYLFPSDFTTKSGCCWLNDNGTVTLIVHSNSNYTFRIAA
jgi:hypothetical protein